jgi:O-antigen/teichoic acid export membrane protein
MFGLMVATMLLPIFGRLLSQKEDIQPLLRMSVNMLLPASFVIAVTGISFSSEIMHFLYRHATEADARVFSLLMAAFPAFSVSNIYSTLLTANGSLKLLNKVAFAGVVINLTLNFILIPQYFSTGAAAAAFVTQTVLAVAFIVSSQRHAALPKNIRWVLSFFFFLLLLASAAYGIRLLTIGWPVQLLLLAATGFILVFLFRFLSLRSVQQLLSRG